MIVSAAVIKANNDTPTAINGKDGGITPSVLDNDMLNGIAVIASEVNLTPIGVYPAGITLNPNGTITVATNTSGGTYTVQYTICEKLNPTNCSTSSVTLVVIAAIIEAKDDTPAAINIKNGGTTLSVLENDILNGAKLNPLDITLTPKGTYPSGITLNGNGTITVKPNVPGGEYKVQYIICEKANPNNCSTGTVTLFVANPVIAIIKTAIFNDENKDGFAQAGETISYQFLVTNTGNVALTNVVVTDNLKGIVFTGTPIALLDVGVSNNYAYVATYSITQADIIAGSVSNQAMAKGRDIYGTEVEDLSDEISPLEDSPTVLGVSGCKIEVFNAISLNGDATNERFYIRGIECYPDNTVEIYNRWGVLVFERDNYNNEERVFKGFSEGRTTIKQSDGLPSGTYYYILKYKDSDSKAYQKAGYLYLTK